MFEVHCLLFVIKNLCHIFGSLFLTNSALPVPPSPLCLRPRSSLPPSPLCPVFPGVSKPSCEHFVVGVLLRNFCQGLWHSGGCWIKYQPFKRELRQRRKAAGRRKGREARSAVLSHPLSILKAGALRCHCSSDLQMHGTAVLATYSTLSVLSWRGHEGKTWNALISVAPWAQVSSAPSYNLQDLSQSLTFLHLTSLHYGSSNYSSPTNGFKICLPVFPQEKHKFSTTKEVLKKIKGSELMHLVPPGNFLIINCHSSSRRVRRFVQLQAHQLYLNSWERDGTNDSWKHFQAN